MQARPVGVVAFATTMILLALLVCATSSLGVVASASQDATSKMLAPDMQAKMAQFNKDTAHLQAIGLANTAIRLGFSIGLGVAGALLLTSRTERSRKIGVLVSIVGAVLCVGDIVLQAFVTLPMMETQQRLGIVPKMFSGLGKASVACVAVFVLAEIGFHVATAWYLSASSATSWFQGGSQHGAPTA